MCGKRNKIVLITFIIIFAILLVLSIVVSGFAISLDVRTKDIMNDISTVFNNDKYAIAHYIDNINVIKQEVSCGYAVMEMFSDFVGGNVTEESLYNEYGKIVTSTGASFRDEMNKQFDGYTTRMEKYLTNTALIDKVYDSLAEGMPVPIEWAAKLDGTWTLHYSLVVGMDVPNDNVRILNPYGYVENIKLDEFVSRTNFSAYNNIPLFIEMGFIFNVFEKNTIFIVEKD